MSCKSYCYNVTNTGGRDCLVSLIVTMSQMENGYTIIATDRGGSGYHICVCVCGLGIAESAEKFKDVLLSADAGAEYDRVVEINLDEVRTVLYSLLT